MTFQKTTLAALFFAATTFAATAQAAAYPDLPVGIKSGADALTEFSNTILPTMLF